uniref:Uncharacterized protein n=1 Tax=Oryza glumipatula TaxID=40148 RepID=A0A0D9Z5U8_9ORYZ
MDATSSSTQEREEDRQPEAAGADGDDGDYSATDVTVRLLCDLFYPGGESELARVVRRYTELEAQHRQDMERCRQAHDELLEFQATLRPGRLGRELVDMAAAVEVATAALEFDGGQEDDDGAAVDHKDTVTIELAPATTTAIDDVDGDQPPTTMATAVSIRSTSALQEKRTEKKGQVAICMWMRSGKSH